MTLRVRAVRVIAPFVAFAGASATCDFTYFDSFRANTPVITLPQPRDYPNLHFGVEIAVATDEAHGDFLVTSGGLGTASLTWPLRANGMIVPRAGDYAYLCTQTAQ
jgi:hypothetical protein